MTRISILYPNHEGARFDVRYYLDIHMRRSIELLSRHPGFKDVAIERGVTGAEPGTAPPYRMICHFSFDSLEDFLAAFTPHAEDLQGDMPNYTDIRPMIQISEVVLSQTR
jgi:uncharacterized protein (TIGR02118 family)